MKKVLSMILILCMLFTFAAGCAKTAETPADETPAPVETAAPVPPDATDKLKDSKPNEYVPEKIAAGEEVIVAYVFQDLVTSFAVLIDQGIQADLEERGYTYLKSSGDNDTSKALELYENYITMGAACILTMMSDPNAAPDICAKAEAAGTYFILVGSVPEDGRVSAAVAFNQVSLAKQIMGMTSAWIDLNYPNAAADGGIHTAILGQIDNTETTKRTETYEDTAKTDSRYYLSYTTNNAPGIDQAFTSMQEALTTDPSIRIVVTFSNGQAIGCNNYIVSMPGVDLAQWCITTAGVDEETMQLINQADTNNGSCIRGTLSFGDPSVDLWVNQIKAVDGLLNGTMEPGVVIDEATLVLNNFGYVYAEG